MDSGRIIDKDVLKKGGTLLIQPFRAGPEVEENERLDELGLKLIQGVADTLKDYRPYFKIITDEGQETADVVLKGYFMDVGSISRLRSWLPGKHKKSLSIKGEMVKRGSDKPILVFTDSTEAEDKTKDYPTLSYELGQRVGRFIRSGAAE